MRTLFYMLFLSLLPLGCLGTSESEKPFDVSQEQQEVKQPSPSPIPKQDPEQSKGIAAPSVWQKHPLAAPILAVVGGVLSVVGLSELTNLAVSRFKGEKHQFLVLQAVSKLRSNKPKRFVPPARQNRNSLVTSPEWMGKFAPLAADDDVNRLLQELERIIPTLVVEQYKNAPGEQFRIHGNQNDPNDPYRGFKNIDGLNWSNYADFIHDTQDTLDNGFKANPHIETILHMKYWEQYVYFLHDANWKTDQATRDHLLAGLARLVALFLVEPSLMNEQLHALNDPPNPNRGFLAYASLHAPKDYTLILYAAHQMEYRRIYPLFVQVP